MADIRRYLAAIGAKGGRKSRRVLSPDAAREMVRVREARRAFLKFHSSCFWSSPRDLTITAADVRWVAEQLMRHGNRDAYLKGLSLKHRGLLTLAVVPLSSREAATPPAPATPTARVALVRELSQLQWKLSGQPLPAASPRNSRCFVLRPLLAQGDER